jgi:hypothetical protein
MMNDSKYCYELYRFERPKLGGHITLSVTSDALSLEDYTIGSTVSEFYGSDEREYTVSLSKEDAIKILEANGIAVGKYPTETLGLYFAERNTGNNSAATGLLKMAEKAGVEAEVSVW